MPTNDERREVAARLREPFDVLLQGGYYHASHTLFGMGLYTSSEVALRLGVCRLADLIEPEERTCRNIANETDREFGNPFICSECGANPHDAESYYCVFSSGEYDWRFCPNCGARVVGE